MRPKPLFGDPCNRCGLCCLTGPCGVATALLGVTEGCCPAVRSDGLGGYVCGVLTEAPLTPVQREALTVAMGTGFGCDATSPDPKDVAARAAHKPAMVRKVHEARAAMSPAARTVLVNWRLAPPR